MPIRDTSSSVVDTVEEDRIQVSPGLTSPPPPSLEPPFGDEPPPSFWGAHSGPPVSNARLGMLAFLTFETMFFAGLIGAFLVFRAGSPLWPPLGQPRLPIIVTWVNTVFLLFSSYTMFGAVRSMRAGDRKGMATGLSMTASLGAVFLVVQGFEWARLIRHGLTLSSGVYGTTFYTLIGCHALHVLAAVIWLLVARLGSSADRFGPRMRATIELCGMYWYFVVALWPILFILVYLG